MGGTTPVTVATASTHYLSCGWPPAHPFPLGIPRPTGHSSWSAAGLGFTTYFLLGQLQAFTGSGQVWKFFIAVLPGLGAVAVACTRVIDYWHHPSDVLTGLALGFLVSFFVYRMFYPTLIHQYCHVPMYNHGNIKPRVMAVGGETDEHVSASRQRAERAASALPF